MYVEGKHGRLATIESTLDCAQASQSDALTCKLTKAQEKKAIKIYMINLRSRVDFRKGYTKRAQSNTGHQVGVNLSGCRRGNAR
jgi:hypothetical protein